MRHATPDDVVAIATVHQRTTRHAYAGIFPPDAPAPTVDELVQLWEPRVLASWRAGTTASRVAVRVAQDLTDEPEAAPIVGIAACEHLDVSPLDGRRDVTLLRSFHVLPSHWDRGLGRALHEWVVTASIDWSATAIDVLVLEDNERGRTWYLRHGYQPTQVRLPAFADLDLHDEGLRRTAPFA